MKLPKTHWNGILTIAWLIPAILLKAGPDILTPTGPENPLPGSLREPTPFIRELPTGFLLNCFFLSPRPYCWPKDEHPLSGWQVEKPGGRLEFSPNCHYPEGFGFHSDWFKLVDTNTQAGLTLSHQIARQTAGTITLEFRFKLNGKMDGSAWQLRDLHEAGISLKIADGHLCWETANGPATRLLPIKNGSEYGVRIIANLTQRVADVYVDGRLVAEGQPFFHPVPSIDFFRVQTGVEATGELFLNPVIIHKGYTVQETFLVAGLNQPPVDWTVTAGEARVETFECGTKPDIFSLHLKGFPGQPAAVSRSFAATTNQVVFEFRFLAPEKRDGMAAELLCGPQAGLRIFTERGGLWASQGNGHATPLAPDYRPNLWYAIQATADARAGTASVKVNGKPAAGPFSFGTAAGNFDRLRFSSEASLWIDDVVVYPWREYPADYVPEPKPVAAQAPLLLGVQSCNLWQEGRAYAGWDYVRPYRADRTPFLGWYDEGHPEETDWEIKWQVEHGIGFEMHCWYRPNNAINHPIKDGVLDHGIIKGLFNARYSHLKKFAIMCTDEGACETNPEDFRQYIIPYWIEYFFKDPRYLTIDGKPVLSIYQLGNLLRMMGGQEGCRLAIQDLRREIARAGLPGIIILMEHRQADRQAMKTMKQIGIDACYAYTWLTPDTQTQQKNNLAQRAAAAAEGFAMLPSISMGWDRSAWGVHDGGWAKTADYQALARWAKNEFIPSLPADALGRRILMLANWNEFGEGHFLMPASLAGFGYLDALREVFTQGGPHEDARPNASQRRRFNVLYPFE